MGSRDLKLSLPGLALELTRHKRKTMSHFAKIISGIVTEVIVADQRHIDWLSSQDGSLWKQTSYNTRGNVHYGPNGQPDGGIAFRGNFAGIGMQYDAVNDVFYNRQPFPSWQLNTSTWYWQAPVACPDDGGRYSWDEQTLTWVAQ